MPENDIAKVIVVGLDGLDPSIGATLMDAGELPHMAGLRERGGFARVATTYPAQTPVAWSSFATGTNPGGHGIFDFLHRNPETYLPDLSLCRFEQKNRFLPPKAVNLRQGTPLWELLSAAGVSSTVLRCPCTFPPDTLRGRMLAGMGVPDLRGGLGTSTFYTSGAEVAAGESEQIVRLEGRGPQIVTQLIGPRHPKTRADITAEITIELEPSKRGVTIRSAGRPRALRVEQGRWSEWLHVKFKAGRLQSVPGIVRFYLARLEPVLELYASPVNFDPGSLQLYPISSPADYARSLDRELGTFYTTGMVEDHTGLSNGRFGEDAYLDQCADVMRERRDMMLFELDRFREGFFYILFDTPDRIQHMFWRFREPEHPANGGAPVDEFRHVIDEHYRECDAIVGQALERADDRTLLIVLSDHGFASFQRGLNLNTWLLQEGLLVLERGARPGPGTAEFFHGVDWSRTRAYSLGLGGIYLNLEGREARGCVAAADAESVRSAIIGGLTGLGDPEREALAVRGVRARDELYSGGCVDRAPDLLVDFAAGYRAGWSGALGGIGADLFEDNVKKWSGDHVVDPSLVPGILLMNRPFRQNGPALTDLAPTILAALGVPRGPEMEGESLLS